MDKEKYECQLCHKPLEVMGPWYTLKHMGIFCVDCALYVLAYWEINAKETREKIERETKVTCTDDK